MGIVNIVLLCKVRVLIAVVEQENYEPGAGAIMADSVSLDWLAFTFVGFRDSQELRICLDVIRAGLGDFEQESGGFNGYSDSARFYVTGRLGWSPDRPEQGVHVSFPSGALGNLALERSWSPFDLLGRVLSMVDGQRFRVQFTRFDVALDDTSGLLDWSVIRSSCSRRSALVTLFRRVWIPRCDLLEEEEVRTIYFGERRSDTFFRFYDKALEQKKEGHHLRGELECKHKRADMLARLCWAAQSFVPAVEYIKRYIEFKEPSESDSNMRRWPTADWWAKFLDVSKELCLAMPRASVSVARSADWLSRQAAAAFAMLYEASRAMQIDIFDFLIQYGEFKKKNVHEAAIKEFKSLHQITLESTGGDLGEAARQLLEFLCPDVPEVSRANYLAGIFDSV